MLYFRQLRRKSGLTPSCPLLIYGTSCLGQLGGIELDGERHVENTMDIIEGKTGETRRLDDDVTGMLDKDLDSR